MGGGRIGHSKAVLLFLFPSLKSWHELLRFHAQKLKKGGPQFYQPTFAVLLCGQQ